MNMKRPTEKNFGMTFAFLSVGLYFYLVWKSLILIQDITLPIISAILIIISLFKPNLLYFPNEVWFKISKILSIVVSPIVLGVTYYLLIAPIGVVFRITGRDYLNLKKQPEQDTYWKKSIPSKSSKNKYQKAY